MQGTEQLYWHCLQCGDHAPVEPTGDGNNYALGDSEKCTECGEGFSHVVTLSRGACYEQGRAMGMTTHDAWARALSLTPPPTGKRKASQKLTAPQEELLSLVRKNGAFICHEAYQPARKLISLGVVDSAPLPFAKVCLKLSEAFVKSEQPIGERIEASKPEGPGESK